MAKIIKNHEDLDRFLEDYHYMPQDYELIDIPTRFEFDEDVPASSFMHDVWVRFKSNKGAIIGGAIILLFLVISIVAPMCSSYSFDAVDTAQQSMAPRVPGLTWMGWFNGEGGIRTCGLPPLQRVACPCRNALPTAARPIKRTIRRAAP